jgi:hypothetical protein
LNRTTTPLGVSRFEALTHHQAGSCTQKKKRKAKAFPRTAPEQQPSERIALNTKKEKRAHVSFIVVKFSKLKVAVHQYQVMIDRSSEIQLKSYVFAFINHKIQTGITVVSSLELYHLTSRSRSKENGMYSLCRQPPRVNNHSAVPSW